MFRARRRLRSTARVGAPEASARAGQFWARACARRGRADGGTDVRHRSDRPRSAWHPSRTCMPDAGRRAERLSAPRGAAACWIQSTCSGIRRRRRQVGRAGGKRQYDALGAPRALRAFVEATEPPPDEVQPGALSPSRLAAPAGFPAVDCWLKAGHAVSAGSSRLERQHRHFAGRTRSGRHVNRPHATADEQRRGDRDGVPATVGNLCAATAPPAAIRSGRPRVAEGRAGR